MYQYLLTRIIPAVCYASALTNIPPKVCKRMNTCIDLVVLPKLGLNRHTTKAVVYGPMMHGGLNYPQFKTIQTTKSIMYLIKQIIWDKDMAKELRVNIEMTHLMSGVETPIMEKTEKPIDYLEESWVLTVRKRL